MKNLVFIGMIGSQMKSVAQKAADKLGRKFVDTDEVLTRNIGMSLHELYTLFPLDSFRDITYRLASQLSQGEDYVIAVGDSILKNADAVNALKETAFTVYIQQDVDSIAADCTEPSHPLLARGLHRLYELFDERAELFSDYSDITVAFSEKAADEVIQHYNNNTSEKTDYDPALHSFFRYYIESKYPSADSLSFADECAEAVVKILEKHIPKE